MYYFCAECSNVKVFILNIWESTMNLAQWYHTENITSCLMDIGSTPWFDMEKFNTNLHLLYTYQYKKWWINNSFWIRTIPQKMMNKLIFLDQNNTSKIYHAEDWRALGNNSQFQSDLHLLISIQDTKWINEWKIPSNGLELIMGDKSILVVIIILEHSLKNQVSRH